MMLKSKGFTFLETLIVISVFSLIFPLALSILFVILQQQFRIFSLSEVKRQGDYVVSYLEDSISNHAYTLYDANGDEVCTADPSTPFPHNGSVKNFRDRFYSGFSVDYAEPELAINFFSPPVFPAPTFAFREGALNNSKVRIESFELVCERNSSFSAPLLRVRFTACYNLNDSCAPSGSQKAVSLNYQTDIKLRSFPTE